MTKITVTPENPSSDDNVVFEFVVFTNGCCKYETSVVGSNYYFDMVPVEPPGPVIGTPVPLDIDWPVGRLRAGKYQVTLTDEKENSETLAFSVSQGELPFPEPIIPAMGVASALVLVVGLALIANKALKRMPKRTA